MNNNVLLMLFVVAALLVGFFVGQKTQPQPPVLQYQNVPTERDLDVDSLTVCNTLKVKHPLSNDSLTVQAREDGVTLWFNGKRVLGQCKETGQVLFE